jgi:hypothetical protein
MVPLDNGVMVWICKSMECVNNTMIMKSRWKSVERRRQQHCFCCWFGGHWSCGARFAVINSREGIIKRDVRDGDGQTRQNIGIKRRARWWKMAEMGGGRRGSALKVLWV